MRKARFSEMLETCLNEGPQLITKRGADAAVLILLKDWQMLKRAAKPTLKELLLADVAYRNCAGRARMARSWRGSKAPARRACISPRGPSVPGLASCIASGTASSKTP
jgi:prevent-host-death family protein